MDKIVGKNHGCKQTVPAACPGTDFHGNRARDDIVQKGGSGSLCSHTAGTAEHGRTNLVGSIAGLQLKQCQWRIFSAKGVAVKINK